MQAAEAMATVRHRALRIAVDKRHKSVNNS
jgi:hypothetical protein